MYIIYQNQLADLNKKNLACQNVVIYVQNVLIRAWYINVIVPPAYSSRGI